jgi:hypothetical protein
LEKENGNGDENRSEDLIFSAGQWPLMAIIAVYVRQKPFSL